MAAKRHSICRVQNPRSDNHTARLKLGQQLAIALDSPTTYSFDSDYQWRVEVKSEYLKQLPVEVVGQRRTFQYKVIGDLSRWATISNTLLGNILIYAVKMVTPDDDPEGIKREVDRELFGRVCVYLDTTNAAKNHIITVIRPTGHHCKMMSGDLLEVILPDYGTKLNWQHYPMPVESDGPFAVQLMRSEYLASDDNNNYRAVSDDYFCEHRNDFHCGEHHFWFALNERSRQNAEKAKPDSYPAVRLAFIGKDDAGVAQQDCSLEISVLIKKKSKEASRHFRKLIESSDPYARYSDPTKRIIASPTSFEVLEFSSVHEHYSVELPQPVIEGPQYAHVKWKAHVEPAIICQYQNHAIRLAVEELNICQIRGVPVQKFRVKTINLGDATDNVELGTVVFKCDATGDNKSSQEKRLRFNLHKKLPKLEIVNSRTSVAVYGPATSPVRSSYEADTYNNNGKKKKKYSSDEPYYSDVKIEHVVLSSTAPLEAGENCVFHNQHGYDSLAYEQEHSLDAGKTLKKNGTLYRKDNNADSMPSAKKNTGSNGSRRNKASVSEARGIDTGAEAMQSAVREASVVPATGACTTSEKMVDAVTTDPQNLESITLTEHDARVIRLPLMDGGAYRDWHVNIIQSNLFHKVKVSPGWERIIDGQVYQEFRLQVIVDPTAKPGLVRAGALRLVYGDNVDTRWIFVEVLLRRPAPPRPTAISTSLCKPYRISRHLRDGIITLIDPLQDDPIELLIAQNERLELILHMPDGNFDDEWAIKTDMHGSAALVYDNAIWRLFDGESVQRVLIGFAGMAKEVLGQITIYRANKEMGRIVLRPRENMIIADFHQPTSQLMVHYDTDRHVFLKNWENKQTLRIHPADHVNIELENLAKYLVPATKCRKPIQLRLNQWGLEKFVLDKLPSGLQKTIDPAKPWWETDGVLQACEPWNHYVLSLPPINTSQQNVNQLLLAYQECWGDRISYPIADLQYSIEAEGQFVLSRELTCHIVNPRFFKRLRSCYNDWMIVDDPADTAVEMIRHAEGMAVKLIPKWIAEGEGPSRTNVFYDWKLKSLPDWMIYLEQHNDKQLSQTFFFYCDILDRDVPVHRGKIVFVANNGKFEKRVDVSGIVADGFK